MFITVKFGNNESILCNPSCAVVNLLSSIKRRAGFKHTNVCIDLSDENGKFTALVLTHRYRQRQRHTHTHTPHTHTNQRRNLVGGPIIRNTFDNT